MATNGNLNHQDQYTGPTMPAPSESVGTSGATARDLSKDEVGWYFVEQYYTTLSKNPEKLHLFYGKKSQFVYGLEAEVTGVSVGRPSIQDRIKQLDFQDCKVRISNVDSQGSSENIVIQVIGETSNKAEEPKKFVQTFVLAQQPSGYFVLNDILRYIKDEPEEEAVEPAAPEEAAAAKEAPAAQEPEAQAETEAQPEAAEAEEPQLDATVVDKKLEEAGAAIKDTPSTSAVNTPAEPAAAPQETATKAEPAAEALDPEKAVKEIAEEEAKKPEVPKDPTPTPVAPRAQAAPVPAEPEKPKEPVKPRSWAAAVAAGAGPKPAAVALPKPAAAPQARAPVPVAAAPQAAAPAAVTPVAAPAAEAAAPKEPGNEWQTAGADSKRQNRPQSMSTAPQEKEGTLGYVKYVTEKVTDKDLRAHLASFGDIVYFDINRTKNCAFVEFGTVAAYQAAISSNPHVVNGENIVVEPRRPKAGAYGGSNYANRGSISSRGRGGFEGSRSGSQGGGRGGFGPGQARGRGGPGGAPRGRGQATNA